MAERDYEAEASEQGWTPKEEWKGPDEKWLNPQTFVERGEKIAGILKSKVDRLESKVEHLTESNKKFGEYHKQTIENQRKKNAERIEQLEAELAQAVTDGDGQAYTKLNREVNDLRTQQVDTPPHGDFDELAQKWVEDNPWYTKNRKLGRYADGISDEVRAEGYTGRAYFSELTRRVHEDFPDEFENPNQSKANGVESGGKRSSTDSKAKSYDNLPADAKAACDEFVAQGFMTRQQYVADYEFE